MTLQDLLVKVEAAESGGRELDGRIAWAFGWRFNGGVTPDDADFKDWPDIAGHWHKPGDRFADILNKAEYRSETEGFPSGRWDDPPEWTKSLDAAVALVEAKLPDAGLSFGNGGHGCTVLNEKWYASVRFGSGPDDVELVQAKTLPLALIAALLRALISQEQPN